MSFPPAVDWDVTFLPAVLALLKGADVYRYIYNPPWALFPLIPFALLPYDTARALLLVCEVLAFGFAAWRIGVKPLGLLAFMLSPFAFNALAWGNVEWLVALGIGLGYSWVGVLLLLIKPQMSIALIVFMLIELARRGKWKAAGAIVASVVIAMSVSFATFGFWLERVAAYTPTHVDLSFNLSLFPLSIPVGLALFAAALRTRKPGYALAASPCFFPMVTPQVWVVAALALAVSIPESIAASLGFWALTLVRGK